MMSRWEKGIAAMAVFFGLCCLLTAATGLSAGTWLPSPWRGLFLVWAPLICVIILALLAGTLLLPPVRSLKLRAIARPMVLIISAATATMALYYIYRG